MIDYIRRDFVLQVIDTVNRLGGFAGYPDYCSLFDEIESAPAADVQPTGVVEHIKQRILETAFNNGGIYSEVAEDIANRIDFWVDELVSETIKG